MLPSPTSLNIPPPSTIHSLASPSLLPQPSSSSAAHTAHLQDLQHQISLKTLALQTLRQEYDALLSKLDRQRTKCSALEKKFEVSDVEINSLTTEKEELEAKVAALEQQVDELREQRDDARRREVRTGEQYRSIVEMASRLQGIAAEEKRAWAQEREGLLKALGWDDGGGGEGGQKPSTQESNVSSTARPPAPDLAMSGLDGARSLLDAKIPDRHPEQASAAATSQVIAALRVEVAQLRSRTQSLEAAIRSIRDQGTAIEEASQAAAEAGKRMREAAREAIGES
ncbi:SPX domain-containing protein [Neofusicoccum parvum]|nr:SPX domain-containing protein [Neofusicoccum parvum]